MSRPGNMPGQPHGRITRKPANFSWVVDGRLAGSGRPTSRDELDWAVGLQGIRCIVTMTEDPLPPQWMAASDTRYLHVPTPDDAAPDHGRLNDAADFIDAQIREGRPVMVHCAAGLGRAGTVLACYLVKYGGRTAEQAIREVREKRPGSIQSAEQETAVAFFARQHAGPDGHDDGKQP